ncbi:FkbM family methyltransferase [Pseudomonas chengduensis]
MIDKFLYAYALIFSRKCFIKWHKFLHRISLSGLGILNYKSDRVSGESNFLKWYMSQVSGVVLDVGGNEGRYARVVRQNNNDVKIYSFEPHPKTFPKLLANTSKINVISINKGLSSEEGTLTLYDYADGDGSTHASLYQNVLTDLHHSNACVAHEVAVTTIDAFVDENNISQISLLKIDVEGNEYEVLRGAKETIASGKIMAIHFEFNEMNVASRIFFYDFWKLLEGYSFYRLLPAGMLEIENYNALYCEIFAYQNIVAIRRSS